MFKKDERFIKSKRVSRVLFILPIFKVGSLPIIYLVSVSQPDSISLPTPIFAYQIVDSVSG
jgi:hypothetical protein